MLRHFARSVRDFQTTPDYSDHRLNWEFWITLSGDVTPVFNDGAWTVESGMNLWIMPPRLRFHWTAPAQVERIVAQFAFVPIEFERFVQQRTFFCRRLDAAELDEARRIAADLEHATHHRDSFSAVRFQRAMLDFILLALRREDFQPSSTLETHLADRAQRALAWYTDHLREAPKFERLAAEMHVSTSHLRRIFQAHFGKSPKYVLDKLRVDRSATLLTSTTATLDDVAQQSGFHSTPDFCRVFKKYFGTPPNMWRRTINEVGREIMLPAAQLGKQPRSSLISGPRTRIGLGRNYRSGHPRFRFVASPMA